MRVTAGLILATFLGLGLAGCGGGGGAAGPTLPPGGGTVVAPDAPAPSGIMPFAEIRQLARGERLRIRLNRSGLEIREFNAFFLSAFTDMGDELITCQLENETVVAAGDSGAPVYTVDGRKVGALAFGTGDKRLFLARSRGQMESLKLNRSSVTATATSTVSVSVTSVGGATTSTNFSSLTPAYAISATPSFLSRISRFGRSGLLGRFRSLGRPPLSAKLQAVGGTVQPGSSISVNLIDGELLRGGAIGSVTDVEGSTLLAFGHGLEFNGPRSLPVSLASVDAIAEDGLFGLFKLAHPEGPTIGALTNDRRFGVRIDGSAIPVTIPVKTIIRLGNSPSLISYNHQVAADQGSLMELDLLVTALTFPVDFVRNQSGGGAADFTLRITRFDGRTVTRSLHVDSPSDLIDEVMLGTFDQIDAERVEGAAFGYIELAIHLTA